MALDVKQYIDQLAQTAGLSQEEKDAILKVTANDKFAKALGDDVLRQQDYSRSMDALKAKEKETTDYYATLLGWEAERKQYWDTENAKLAGRQPTTQQQPTFDPTAFEKKWKEELDRRDQQSVGLLKIGMNLASKHAVEFKEALDTEALAKIAVEKNMTLQQAYDEYVSPRRAEAQKLALDERVRVAREEGARDALAKHKLPVDTAPREYHVMFDRDPKKQVGADDYVPNSGRLSHTAERSLRDNFVEDWNKAGSAATSGT